ncbi:MAG: protein kinase, partial [Myxococcota bacterium]
QLTDYDGTPLNVVHRDVTPSNVFLTYEGIIKLVDFGLAVETDRTRITQHGMAFGTVSYAPPEWIHPETLDAANWDLYALGVVFFEMLTGRLAFPVSGQGSARQQAMQVIVGKQGHRPLDPGSTFPDATRAIVGALTHAEPAERQSDLDEVVSRLEAIVAVAPPPGPSPLADPSRIAEPPDHTAHSEGARTWRSDHATVTVEQFPRRGMWVAALGAGFGLGLLALGAVVAWWIVSAIGRAPRDVAVVADADMHVVLDGRLPQNGSRTFIDIPTGRGLELQWARGEGCRADVCPGEACPVWCGAGRQSLVVPEGEGVYTIEPAFPAVPRHAVTFELTAYADAASRLETSVDGLPGQADGHRVRFGDLTPGSHRLLVRGGKCPPDALPCWPEGQCSERCVVHEAEVVVPWVGLGVPVVVDVPAPVRRGLFDRLRRRGDPDPAEAPAPRVAPTTAEGHVTTSAFATWLVDRPEWQRDGAKGQVQGGRYLKGWSGAEPPATARRRSPVTGVSYAAARAFCKSRGGLPAPDASPETWNEQAAGVSFEWRENGFNPMLREGTGGLLPGDSQTAGMISVTGVRCAR